VTTAEQTPEAERSIEWVPLDDLLPDPANPKGHDEAVIAGSMTRFGMVDLITRDDRTGYIISGHGRLKSLTNLRDQGATPPSSVRVTEDGTWLTPVVTGWSSTDDLDARGALITLNRATELGGWVDDSLLTLLDQLREADALNAVGFKDAELEILRRKIEAEEVFSVGTEHMLDEFRSASGQSDTDYQQEYARKVTVYLRDEAAIEDFKTRLSLPDEPGARLHLPLGWEPYDRRRTWQQERETGE
jgi:hypothetical protein